MKNMDGEVNLSDVVNFLESEENLTFIEKSTVLEALVRFGNTDYTRQLASEIVSVQDVDGSFGSIPDTVFALNALVGFHAAPPDIAIISPQNTTYLTSSVELNYSLYDLDGIDWAGYSLDGEENVTLTGNTTLTNLSDGQHNITLYASDTQGNLGSSTVNFTVNTSVTSFNLSLSAGWNLISIPVVPENTSLTSVLASIEGNYSVVYGWINGGWKRSTDPRDPLTTMDTGYGYWIYAISAGSYDVTN